MKRLLLKLTTAVLVILFLLSASLMVFAVYAQFLPDEVENTNYSYMTFSQEIETRSFQLERKEVYPGKYPANYAHLLFFNSKYVNFLDAIPNLKIVNSEDYRVEITANSDVFDHLVVKLDLFMTDYMLKINFKEECYAELWDDWDGIPRAYYGLNATLDVFDVIVYAPIESITSDASLTLDYEAPSLVDVYAEFHGDSTVANIHTRDNHLLRLICTGTNKITISGSVKHIKVHAIHNSKVDASGLTAETYDFYTSTGIGICDFSYVKYDGRHHINFFGNNNIIWTLVIKYVIYVLPFIWLGLLISCIVKLRRLRR